ncbi:MAG TPA: hypothetical protein P5268_07980 [Candidatus Marinimicrobia bacterium]|nr:hypothetical protein [Candidatus Neomarinimicrobiota bacterium]HRS52769.1 hypothetical protein [Candidatus Neomarinimicrobiota bacterium]HRU92952.1 hypothetical protein [Candidatus Neomarinimicrobiota bacterium]
MNVIEYLNEFKSEGIKLTKVNQNTNIPSHTLNRIKKGMTINPRVSNFISLSNAFGYNLKYEHSEPQFYKSEELLNIRIDPEELSEVLKIKEYLGNLGINNLEELQQCFYDAGAVFGRKEDEITELFRSLRALDTIRNLVKSQKCKVTSILGRNLPILKIPLVFCLPIG